ncbi:MAG: hypothetical protein VX670_11170, partial [Candidatus Latescibacterota bacterium]|nr:hypothetical protein [Candidatus Latescibacterota bacterium]
MCRCRQVQVAVAYEVRRHGPHRAGLGVETIDVVARLLARLAVAQRRHQRAVVWVGEPDAAVAVGDNDVVGGGEGLAEELFRVGEGPPFAGGEVGGGDDAAAGVAGEHVPRGRLDEGAVGVLARLAEDREGAVPAVQVVRISAPFGSLGVGVGSSLRRWGPAGVGVLAHLY